MSASTIALPHLRSLPLPVAEPRPALRVVRDHDLPAVPLTQGVLSLDAAPDGTGAAAGAGYPPVPAADVAVGLCPPAQDWTRQFVRAALEVAAGRRPASQLVRWTSEDVLTTLARRGALAGRLPRGMRAVTTTTVGSVRLCRTCPAAIEASAVVNDRGRIRAVALRLEDAGGRWRVTALEIG